MHNILIVSDDLFIADLLMAALGDLEVQLYSERSVERAAAACRSGRYDLVLLLTVGALLCKCGGVETIRPRGLKRPRIYVLSWQQSEQIVLSLLEQGVDQYLTLPISLERLRGKIRREITETER